jgi:hypothetical protein
MSASLRRLRDELDCAVLIVEHDMRNNSLVVASYLGSEEVAISRSGVSAPSRTLAGDRT